MKQTKTLIKAKGLVIKENDVGENDRLIWILTDNYGLIKAFGSGAKNHKNKKFAASSMLCYSDFAFAKVGDTYKIYDCFLIESFFDVGGELVNLAYSQYFCEIALVLAPEGTEAREFLRLMLNSLKFISVGTKNIKLIKAITELRAASVSGFMPNLVACENCAVFESEKMYFDTFSSCLYCENCYKEKPGCVPLNLTVLTAMRHIIYSDFDKIYSFTIPEKDINRLSEVTERYLLNMSEHKFTTLDFLKSIL